MPATLTITHTHMYVSLYVYASYGPFGYKVVIINEVKCLKVLTTLGHAYASDRGRNYIHTYI